VLRPRSRERERERTQCFGVPIVRRCRRRLDTASHPGRVDPCASSITVVGFVSCSFFSANFRCCATHAYGRKFESGCDRERCQDPRRRWSRYDNRLLTALWYYFRSSLSRCRSFVSLRRPRFARRPYRKLTFESFIFLHCAAKGMTRGFHRPDSIRQ